MTEALESGRPGLLERLEAGAPSPRTRLVEALRRPRYEVLPVAGTADEVAEHVPADLPVTVTASPRRGLDATLSLAEALTARGYVAVPHLAARQIVDDARLVETLHRLSAIGVWDAFVVAGDDPVPAGDFADSVELLAAVDRLGRDGRAPVPRRLGVAGYPEGHPLIRADDLVAALRTKQAHATYLVSQLCFDATTISAWLSGLRGQGVRLPLHVGVVGAVNRRRLLRIVQRIGVGPSARFLRKHNYGPLRLLQPGGYRPDSLVQALAADLADSTRGVTGLHVYTLGDVAATERWRRRMLDRLSGDEGAVGDRDA